ncbi:MAG: hypothetical protein JWM90_2358 [Thermoleophilia bacterium]|nr:hypothetical protein [Thermoleophilia bacterium]
MNSGKSLGLGIPVLLATLAICVTGNLATTWGLVVVGGGAILAGFDEFVAGRPAYAAAWLGSMACTIAGYLLWQPWGAPVGLVVGALAMSPMINAAERRDHWGV